MYACMVLLCDVRVHDASLNVENRIICVHNDSTNKIDDELIGFALFATNQPTSQPTERPGPFNQMNSIYMWVCVCIVEWVFSTKSRDKNASTNRIVRTRKKENKVTGT